MTDEMLQEAAETYGKEVAKGRNQDGEVISQKQFAYYIGVSREYLNRIEHGTVFPDFDVQMKIAWEQKRNPNELTKDIQFDFSKWHLINNAKKEEQCQEKISE